MPIQRYGVLRGQVEGYTPGSGNSPHFQIIIADLNGTEYQVDVNVRSRDGSEVLFYTNNDLPISNVHSLLRCDSGITPLASTQTSGALDYLREPLLNIEDMVPLPVNGPSSDDLNTYIGSIVESARVHKASVFAFGQYFHDRGSAMRKDVYEGLPTRGIHDIHMNQGNPKPYQDDNGIYQDGALLIYFPATQKWVANYFAFQTQAFNTDHHGYPVGPSWSQSHGGEKMGDG